MRGAATLDRLGPEDAQILKLEAGAVCGHTCKVLILEPHDGRDLPTLAALRESIESRLDAAPRLRERLVETPLRVARPVWLDDQRFDIAQHVTPVQTAGPVSQTELRRIVGELMTRRLDRSRPLWHIDVIEELDDGSMALVWRIHHCMADGATCMRIGSGMLWSADPDLRAGPCPPWTPRTAPGPLELLTAGLAARTHRRTRDRSSMPSRRPARPRVRFIARRELTPRASVTRLGRRIGRTRTVAFAQAPLEQTKLAGKAID